MKWCEAAYNRHQMPHSFEPVAALKDETAASLQTARPTAKGSGLYRPELDGLRFFAFLAIFLHHWFNQGWVAGSAYSELLAALTISLSYAVSLFFLLSAFLITTLFDAEMARTGTIHVRAFYARRILRIWPLYYFFFALSIVAGLLFRSYRVSGAAMGAFSLFAGNWLIVDRGWAAVRFTFGSLWSVSIEEQFYLVCPLIAAWGRRRWLVAASVACLCLSYATLMHLGIAHRAADNLTRPNTLVQMQFFAAGTLLALLLGGLRLELRLSVRALLVLLGATGWVVAAYYLDPRSLAYRSSAASPAAGYLMILAGSVAMLLGFLDAPAAMISKGAVDLGKVSYGLYVYHQAVLAIFVYHRFRLPGRLGGWLNAPAGPGFLLMTALKFLVSLGLTVLLARLSYRWLERPFLLLKERFSFVRSRPA